MEHNLGQLCSYQLLCESEDVMGCKDCALRSERSTEKT